MAGRRASKQTRDDPFGHGLPPFDPRAICRDIVRDLRGELSQREVSRRLGVSPDACHRWEQGKQVPLAVDVFRLASLVGRDAAPALERFLSARSPNTRVARVDRVAILRTMKVVRSSLTVEEIAELMGTSRFTVARWLSGSSAPRFTDLIAFVHACTQLGVLDMISCLVDPETLPSVRSLWAGLREARRLFLEVPFTDVVSEAIRSEAYLSLEAHVPGAVAKMLQITLDEEERALEALAKAGMIRIRNKKWEPIGWLVVDYRTDEARRVQMARFWTTESLRRMVPRKDAIFAYAAFGASAEQLADIRRLQLEFLNRLRAIVSVEQRVDRVALLSFHLLPLDPPPED